MIVFFADLIKEYWPKENKKCVKKQWICTVEKAFLFLENGSFVMVLLWQFDLLGHMGEGYQMIDLIYGDFRGYRHEEKDRNIYIYSDMQYGDVI